MNGDEIERSVRQAIIVTPQMVVLAKTRVLAETEAGGRGSDELITMLVEQHGCMTTPRVDVQAGVDHLESIAACAKALSWREATIEAIWGLIADGLLVPASDGIAEGRARVHWSIKSGSSASGSSFDLSLTAYPTRIGPLPSARSGYRTLLSCGDLYLQQLGAIGMHRDIEAATKESVACFRRGLFSGAVALLGKVSEGAWIELGEVLVDKFPPLSSSSIANHRSALESPHTGPMQKIKAVKEILLRQEYLHVRDSVGFNSGGFEQAVQWSDLVRGSRNAIHFGATPTVPNTYESVAVLLLAAQQHLGLLYRIRSALLG